MAEQRDWNGTVLLIVSAGFAIAAAFISLRRDLISDRVQTSGKSLRALDQRLDAVERKTELLWQTHNPVPPVFTPVPPVPHSEQAPPPVYRAEPSRVVRRINIHD